MPRSPLVPVPAHPGGRAAGRPAAAAVGEALEARRLLAAAPVPVGGPENVSSTAEMSEGPNIAADGGRLYAAWNERRRELNPPRPDAVQFKEKQIGSAGGWAGLQNWEDGVFAKNQFPDVAVTADGTTHVVYPSEAGNLYHRSRPAGGSWSGTHLIATDDFPNPGRIAAAGDGTLWVVWRDRDGNAVRYRRSTDGGLSWTSAGGTGNVATQPGSNMLYPSLAVDQNGVPHVLWYRQLAGLNNRTVYWADWNGAGWTTGTVGDQGDYTADPAIAVGPGNVQHAVFRTVAGNDWIVRYVSRAPGGMWSAPVDVQRTPGNAGYAPSVAADAAGGVHVVWTQLNGSGRDVFYRFKAPGEGSFRDAWNVSEHSTGWNSRSDVVTTTADGKTLTHIVYQRGERGQDIDDIYYRAYQSDYLAPTADVVDVSPAPRTDGVGTIEIRFSEPVRNVDVADLRLTRDGTAVSLAGASLAGSNGNRTWTLTGIAGATGDRGAYELRLIAAGSGIVDDAGNVLAAGAVDSWRVVAGTASVEARRVFYNRSVYDDGTEAGDDASIAPDKQALLPGQTATAANVISYSRGITGVMIDVADLPADTLGTGDFRFRVGNGADPSTWTEAPAPSAITVRRGAGTGGSDRVVVEWADGAIVNKWLQLTLLANAATGLSSPDAFYVGNAVGETFDATGNFRVDSRDVVRTRNAQRRPTDIGSEYDHNRDGRVSSRDLGLARNNQRFTLQTFAAPAAVAMADGAADAADAKDGTAAAPQGAPAPPFAVGGDPSVNPADFRVTTFATGLNFPYGMQQLPDGSILVGTSAPNPGGGYFNSTGQLVRLVDADGDGTADGPPTVLAGGLPGTITDVRQAGQLVFVTARNNTIVVLRKGATPAAAYTNLGSIQLTFPAGWEHLHYALATRLTPGGPPGTFDLFFNVGSRENAATTPESATVTLGGLLSGTVLGDSIYKVTVRDTGAGAPAFSGLTRVAKGLRNAAGIAVDPASGDLYFEDNGIDGFVNRQEPESADELNRIPAAQIGAGVVDFGFAHDYIQYRTGTRVGGGGVQPLVVFQPIPDPATGSESEGPAQIAIAPAGFPVALRGGVFVGFHGRHAVGLDNEENPVAFADPRTGRHFHFVSNDEPAIAHPDGLLATADSLFVADLDPTTSYGTAGTGVIYQVRATTPATVVGRRVFYNNSKHDDPAGNPYVGDDTAVAPDKTPLLPGQAASAANYTNYSRGINGVMIDLAGIAPGAVLSASDFQLKAGNDNRPDLWAAAPPPAAVTVRRGAGARGSDRVTLTWPDGQIRNTWLQITVKANANTRLAAPDVFYFGNAVGETFDATGNFRVDSRDVVRTRNAQRRPTDIGSEYDHNRDGRVDSRDVVLSRSNQTFRLARITAPPGA